ncbi:MAG: rod shape-determining protein MreD [Deltaproteobacteria bacterium]|nr:rod shape-determining protein MreD [Deltaproteobacteria bacterium]
MNRRHVALFLAGYVSLLILTPIRQLISYPIPFPDVVLLVVIYLALAVKGSPSAGVAVAVALGYMADLFSGAPKGVYSLSLGVCYFAVRGLSARLYFRGKLSQAIVALLVSVVTALMQIGLVALLGPYSFWTLLTAALATAVATAIVAPPVFWILIRLDRRVAPEIVLEGLAR